LVNNISALVCGVLFGVGLAMSGMTDTAKVQGFLDILGDWIPDLAFVMGGAVLVTLVLTRPILQRPGPLFADSFHLPEKTVIDRNLVVGSLCFGIGWGLYGYCPGPAIASLSYLDWNACLFVAAMLGGMVLAQTVLNRQRLHEPPPGKPPVGRAK
jgi:uncharacterized membrane protein YedE/YeeE